MIIILPILSTHITYQYKHIIGQKSVLPFHTQDCYPFCNCVTEMHLPFLLPMQLPTPSTLQSLESNRLFICSVIYISLRSNVSLVNRTSIGKSRFDPLIFSLCDEVSCRIRCCLFVLFVYCHSYYPLPCPSIARVDRPMPRLSRRRAVGLPRNPSP